MNMTIKSPALRQKSTPARVRHSRAAAMDASTPTADDPAATAIRRWPEREVSTSAPSTAKQ